jgi:murein L,D-transpeptidase YafK
MLRNVLRLVLFLVASITFAIQAQIPTDQSTHADRIVVVKSMHTMTLYEGGKELRTFHVWLGRGAGNAKQQQGDNETPEGNYTIIGRNPNSVAHRSLHISYPNAADLERARRLHVKAGGDIMIHGLPPGNDWVKPGQQLPDWTFGCIALTNSEMDEVWKLVPLGTPIEIRH